MLVLQYLNDYLLTLRPGKIVELKTELPVAVIFSAAKR